MSKATKSKTGSSLEEKLLEKLLQHGFPKPILQKVLYKKVRERVVDFYWPRNNLIVEVQGGTWMVGKHSRGVGARTDAEKLNYAAVTGKKMLYVTSDMIADNTALDWIYLALFGQYCGYSVYGHSVYVLTLTAMQMRKLNKYVKERLEVYGKQSKNGTPKTFDVEVVSRFRRKRRKPVRKLGASTKPGVKRVADRGRTKSASRSDGVRPDKNKRGSIKGHQAGAAGNRKASDK